MNQTISLSQLTLDPHNPRISWEPGGGGQDSIIERLWTGSRLSELTREIRQGLYIGPPAMLVVREDGKNVIIDGNRQAAALAICHHPDRWRITEAEHSLWEMDPPEPGDPSVTMNIMESREQAMKARIRRETANRTLWNLGVVAVHVRELRLQGWEKPDITGLYIPAHITISWMNPDLLIQTLDLMEQVNTHAPHQWRRSYHFRPLYRALGLESIRKHLGLGEARDHPPRTPPLKKGSIQDGERLLKHVNGTPPKSPESRRAMIESTEEIGILGEVYQDPRALELLEHPAFHSAQQVMNHIAGRSGAREIQSKIESLEAMANMWIKRMREEPQSPLDIPGNICVADVTHEMHRDGTSQYRVILISRDPERDRGVQEKLQEELQRHDGQKCAVELHTTTRIGEKGP